MKKDRIYFEPKNGSIPRVLLHPGDCGLLLCAVLFQSEGSTLGALTVGDSAAAAAHLNLGQRTVVLSLAVIGTVLYRAFDVTVVFHTSYLP